MTDHEDQRQISRTAVALIMLGTVLLVVGVPYAYEIIFRNPYFGQSGLSRFLMSASKGATIFFVAFVGASIGSFINVVAYRMPLGISVVHSPSACPRCRIQIHGRDNIPVYGWLMLGGRCRNCGMSISARYALVELWFGLFFFVLVMFELITSSANLPGPRLHHGTGVSETIWYVKWDVIGIFAFHCFAIGTLTTWSLFKVDRNRIPLLAWLMPLSFAFAAAISFPVLTPVNPLPQSGIGEWAVRIASPAIGLGAGLTTGLMIEALLKDTGFNHFPTKGLVIGVGFTGLALGWQAMLSTCLLFGLFYFFSRFLVDVFVLARGPLLGIFTLATLTQICLWETLCRIPFWPGDQETGLAGIAMGVGGTIACVLAVKYLLPFQQEIEEFQSRGYGSYSTTFQTEWIDGDEDDLTKTDEAEETLADSGEMVQPGIGLKPEDDWTDHDLPQEPDFDDES